MRCCSHLPIILEVLTRLQTMATKVAPETHALYTPRYENADLEIA